MVLLYVCTGVGGVYGSHSLPAQVLHPPCEREGVHQRRSKTAW